MPLDNNNTGRIDIRLVFSDVDGTLVHYPETIEDFDDSSILKLPPSATGMQGIISFKTLALCQELRRKGMKFVLVSGMRTSTLLKRLPFLPLADAYCSEAGGRIFYARPASDDTKQTKFQFIPPSSEGSEELSPVELVEDLEWRQQMNAPQAAGTDGYSGAELDLLSSEVKPVPIEKREGKLWDYAQQLLDHGFVLDTKGYATCFRVNRKQQTKVSTKEFDQLMRGELLPCPPELSTSTNLGCIDYYPFMSGKKNCCQYLANKFLADNASTDKRDKLSQHCVCLCDDDNDLAMASWCQHAFIPGISSDSMAKFIAQNPTQFSVLRHNEGTTESTENAISLLLQKSMR